MRFICASCHSRQEEDGIPLMKVGQGGSPEQIGVALKCKKCGRWTTEKYDPENDKNKKWLNGESQEDFEF